MEPFSTKCLALPPFHLDGPLNECKVQWQVLIAVVFKAAEYSDCRNM